MGPADKADDRNSESTNEGPAKIVVSVPPGFSLHHPTNETLTAIVGVTNVLNLGGKFASLYSGSKRS
jgi:hypothetical protein